VLHLAGEVTQMQSKVSSAASKLLQSADMVITPVHSSRLLSPVLARGNPPSLLIHLLPLILLYLLVSFTFSLFPFLLALSIFLIFHPFPFYQNTPTLSRLDVIGGCLNLALGFVLILCYMYLLVKYACSFCPI